MNKRMLLYFLTVMIVLIFSIILYLQMPQFGALPSGERLERIKKSPNYKNGSFQNLILTPDLAEGTSYFDILKAYLSFPQNLAPPKELPAIRTDLKSLPDSGIYMVWFGHSSYLLKVNGKCILVDPVFSGNASPVSFLGGNYKGSNRYFVEDMPKIDLVLISHDHYDHLDYETILKLKETSTKFYCSLGVGAHLNKWGISDDRIVEFDWWDSAIIDSGIQITATPARHFSGRGLKRMQSLWSSFVLETNNTKIFVGGDSGYDSTFSKIADKFGGFDLAILECGQYNKYWPYIHMMPNEIIQAGKDLNTKVLLPVHWSKFTLALHPWNEPIKEISKFAKTESIPLCTPLIGELIEINETYPDSIWWEF